MIDENKPVKVKIDINKNDLAMLLNSLECWQLELAEKREETERTLDMVNMAIRCSQKVMSQIAISEVP